MRLDLDERADAAYDAWVVSILDDEDEARAENAARDRAKRAASGVDPDELFLADAYLEGLRAGKFAFGASLNPYQHGVPGHAEWERGRMAGLASRLRERPT